MRMTRRDLLKAASFAVVANQFMVTALNRRSAAQVAGEAATICEHGGRFIPFIGENAWFRDPADRWPDGVDVGAVARFAKGAADLPIGLANQLS